MFDLCPHCDGTGERDWLSGARCYECNGTGWVQECDPDDDEWFDDEPGWWENASENGALE